MPRAHASAASLRHQLESALGDLLPEGSPSASTRTETSLPPLEVALPCLAPRASTPQLPWPAWGLPEADVRLWEAAFARNIPWCRAFVFTPGMLFGSSELWWPPARRRASLHEGIDYGLYADPSGDTHPLPTGTVVPCVMSGEVVALLADFLGKSVVVRHGDVRREGLTLHAVYGHVVPTVRVGAKLRAGDAVGKLTTSSKSSAPAHLHLSAAWLGDRWLQPGVIAELDWRRLASGTLLLGCPAAVPRSQIRHDSDASRLSFEAAALAHGSLCTALGQVDAGVGDGRCLVCARENE